MTKCKYVLTVDHSSYPQAWWTGPKGSHKRTTDREWIYATCPVEPNYPVPALRYADWIGGVVGDCVMTEGGWFVDWSRGTIRVY